MNIPSATVLASSNVNDWPSPDKCLTRLHWVRLRYGSVFRSAGASTLQITPHAADFASCAMFNSHGQLLPFNQSFQALHDAPRSIHTESRVEQEHGMFRITSFRCVGPFSLRGKKRPIHAPVAPAPSKIPYGGFSPVRLQAGSQRRPSLARPAYTTPEWRSRLCAFNSVVRAYAQAAHTASDTTHPPSGPWLRHRLCCPAASLLTMATSEALAFRYVLFVSSAAFLNTRASPFYSACPLARAIVLTPVVSSDFIRLFIHHRCCFHPVCRDSATTSSNQSGPAGCFTRLQRSLDATARFHRSPCPAKAFTSELALQMSPPNSVGYDYVDNNQFPRLVFHQQDKQPYGLHTHETHHEITETHENTRNFLSPFESKNSSCVCFSVPLCLCG